MLFNSFEYFIFLPIVFFGYWFLFTKLHIQNLFIVAASYFFYACWDWRFLSLIIITTISSWWAGKWMERLDKQPAKRKAVNIANISLNLVILAIFKYYGFFADSLASLLLAFGMRTDFPTLHLILPVGISFYTFQAVGYSIDIYRRKIAATDDPIAFAAFICFFPQLVAGPIESASHLLPQITQKRKFCYNAAVNGCRLILWGLFKKMVVADNCAVTVDMVWNDYAHFSSPVLAITSILFAIQIYCDFSGYSDIAIGTAKLFGIDLVQNFRRPYFSTDIREFWRRWHISLMTWFRDYLYIPLGGSRGSRWLTIRNTYIVFLLSGLWHGANWTFIAWGAYHALLFTPAILFGKKIKNTLLTFIAVTFGWIIFRAPDLESAVGYVTRMLTAPIDLNDFSGITAIGVSIVCMAAEWLTRRKEHVLDMLETKFFRFAWVRAIVYYVILVSLCELSARQESFIYFQF